MSRWSHRDNDIFLRGTWVGSPDTHNWVIRSRWDGQRNPCWVLHSLSPERKELCLGNLDVLQHVIWRSGLSCVSNQWGSHHFTGGGLTAHRSEPQLEKYNTTCKEKCKCWRRERGKTLAPAVGVRMAGRLQSSCKWLSNYRTLQFYKHRVLFCYYTAQSMWWSKCSLKI